MTQQPTQTRTGILKRWTEKAKTWLNPKPISVLQPNRIEQDEPIDPEEPQPEQEPKKNDLVDFEQALIRSGKHPRTATEYRRAINKLRRQGYHDELLIYGATSYKTSHAKLIKAAIRAYGEYMNAQGDTRILDSLRRRMKGR